MKHLVATSILLFCLVGRSRAAEPPQVFLCDPQAMAANRERARASDPALAPALASLKAEADKDLKGGPYSVTQKKHPSPTGDPHDYISLAPYFWPNPDTKDGLPYVRHDGRRNPEVREYDASAFSTMSSHVHTLALAYYLTGNDAYADRAALLLRTWFLDPQSRMNPNLQHAQLVKGVNDGRGTGVLEADRLLGVVDAVGLLQGSRAWTEADQSALKDWFRAFVTWMCDSKNGKEEAAAKNNHGSWYDVQVVTYLLFLGADSDARKVAEEAKQRRIEKQIQPDGSLPLELARTNSLGYTMFDLKALTELADVARRVDVDLWNYKSADGRSLRAAINYVLPYLAGGKKWERQQITPFKDQEAVEPLRRAAIAYHDAQYREALAKIEKNDNGVDLHTPLADSVETAVPAK